MKKRLPGQEQGAFVDQTIAGYIGHDKGLPLADCPHSGEAGAGWRRGWRLAQQSADRWGLKTKPPER